MPSIYPYSLDPEKYAEYKRRYVRVPTWETFNNLPQFAILRSFTQQNVAGRYGNIRLTDIQEKLDAYVDACGLGTVVWPHTHTVWAENFPELVEEIKKRGLYLFDIWSYRPGYMRNGTLSNWRAPAGMPESLVASLGDHFLGFDNGEQDGRYVSQYGRQQCPSPTEGPRQLQNFLRHFGGLWDNLGNQITTLISLNYIHYFLKEGNHLLGGAETAQSLPNSQIYYAFIRGAGKQYGIHWFGNVSVWNRRGWKVYFEDDEIEDRRDDGTRSDGGPRCGAQWGTSLSLLKRNMYTHWMYDSVILGFENSWFRKSNPSAVTTGEFEMGTDLVGGPEALSPIGIIQAEAKKFVEKHGRPGAMHTPLAVIIDFFAGWTVPRHLYTKNVYQVWGARPYSPQDYFVHGMLSQVYPGYENSGFFEDERGYLTETPYGDIVDCLLSDVRLSVLGRYSLILCAAGYDGDVELADKLSAAASRGATVFLSGAGASRLFPGWCIQEADHMDAGSVVEVDGGGAITEQYGFSLLHASSLP